MPLSVFGLLLLTHLPFAAPSSPAITVKSWDDLKSLIAHASHEDTLLVKLSPPEDFKFNGSATDIEIGIDGKKLVIDFSAVQLSILVPSRIFNLTNGAHVTMSNFTFESSKNSATGPGGAISATDSTLVLQQGALQNFHNWPSHGGCVAVSNSTLTLSQLYVQGCASSTGGVLFATKSVVTVSKADFSQSFVNGYDDAVGGAMFLDNCDLDMYMSSFENNGCNNGGCAIQMSNTRAHIRDTSFTKNRAGGDASGGALSIKDSSIVMLRVNFSSNIAEAGLEYSYFPPYCHGGGGAIWVSNSILHMTEPRFVGNTAAIKGGALDSMESTVSIVGGHFEGNLVRGNHHAAGAIYAFGGLVRCERCTCADNGAVDFGGNVTDLCKKEGSSLRTTFFV